MDARPAGDVLIDALGEPVRLLEHHADPRAQLTGNRGRCRQSDTMTFHEGVLSVEFRGMAQRGTPSPLAPPHPSRMPSSFYDDSTNSP